MVIAPLGLLLAWPLVPFHRNWFPTLDFFAAGPWDAGVLPASLGSGAAAVAPPSAVAPAPLSLLGALGAL